MKMVAVIRRSGTCCGNKKTFILPFLNRLPRFKFQVFINRVNG